MTDLLHEIEQFIAASDMTPIAFGIGAVNDPHLIRDLHNGRELRSKTVEKVRKYIADNQPQKAAVA